MLHPFTKVTQNYSKKCYRFGEIIFSCQLSKSCIQLRSCNQRYMIINTYDLDLTYLVCSSRWKNFKRQMLFMRAHSDSKGFELKRPHDSIYSFPCPNCMCHVNKTENRVPTSVTQCLCNCVCVMNTGLNIIRSPQTRGRYMSYIGTSVIDQKADRTSIYYRKTNIELEVHLLLEIK